MEHFLVPQMIDGGAVSPNLHGQVDRSTGNGGGVGPSSTDRDLMVYQQLSNLIQEGYTEVSEGTALIGSR